MNTLMIDSESEKVQLWLENSIVVNSYLREDAQKLSKPNKLKSEMISE